jgi:hypothetical protein
LILFITDSFLIGIKKICVEANSFVFQVRRRTHAQNREAPHALLWRPLIPVLFKFRRFGRQNKYPQLFVFLFDFNLYRSVMLTTNVLTIKWAEKRNKNLLKLAVNY